MAQQRALPPDARLLLLPRAVLLLRCLPTRQQHPTPLRQASSGALRAVAGSLLLLLPRL
jgi:hypothetical protein